jgi:hypothetical protein
VLGFLCVLLASCGGGSGSTGLITSEDAVIDDVRQTGTCEELDGVTYCATDSPDATAPGGQSVSVDSNGGNGPTPVRTPTPTPRAADGTASPTPAAGSTSTPAGGGQSTPTPARTVNPVPTRTANPTRTASPAPTATPGSTPTVSAVVDGFAPGAACAVAARPAGSTEVWKTADLVTVETDGTTTTFPVPPGIASPLDSALLCFDDPPATLPAELTTLADAAPTVVFVLPES